MNFENSPINIVRRFASWLGLPFCFECGKQLSIKYILGYQEKVIYECSHCDHLERFNICSSLY